LSLLPIGAYNPELYFRCIHVTPEEAVQIHIDLASKYSVAMHFGTFNLSYEPIFEPKQRTLEAIKKREGEMKDTKFLILNHGESLLCDHNHNEDDNVSFDVNIDH